MKEKYNTNSSSWLKRKIKHIENTYESEYDKPDDRNDESKYTGTRRYKH